MSVQALGRFSEFVPQKVVDDLIQKASDALTHSYCPYSNYPVGAAVLTESGNIYTGCNVESATYTPTICAERTAIVKAVSNGDRKIVAVAIVLGEGGSPCGVCRQTMNEFNPHTYVFFATRDGVLKNEWRLDELLPHGFGPSHLLTE